MDVIKELLLTKQIKNIHKKSLAIMKPEQVLVNRAKIYYTDNYNFDIEEPTAFEVFSKGYGGRYDPTFFIGCSGYNRTLEESREDSRRTLQRTANDIKKLRNSTTMWKIQDVCDELLLGIKKVYNNI